jgi:hypothetical protein
MLVLSRVSSTLIPWLLADFGAAGSYDTQVQVLGHFVRNATFLTSLNIGFGRNFEDLFRKWSTNAPQTNLTTLHLDDVSTRYEFWSAYIGSCSDNLKRLMMNRVAFTQSGEHRLIFQFLASRSLSHRVLRRIKVDDKCLSFDKLYESMPKTRFEYRKAPNRGTGRDDLVEVPRIKYPSHELHLCNSHDGDDEVNRGLSILLGFSVADLASRITPWWP